MADGTTHGRAALFRHRAVYADQHTVFPHRVHDLMRGDATRIEASRFGGKVDTDDEPSPLRDLFLSGAAALLFETRGSSNIHIGFV